MPKILRPNEISNNFSIDAMANLNALEPYVGSKMSNDGDVLWLDIKPAEKISAMIIVDGASSTPIQLDILKVGLEFNDEDKAVAVFLQDKKGESHNFNQVVEVFALTKLF